METKSWLWPDRTIGKRESRRLREDHNATVNLNAQLLEALAKLRLEAMHYRNTKVGEQFLNSALDSAEAILMKVGK